jgi:transcriptional regulator with XRE-family HTH domain
MPRPVRRAIDLRLQLRTSLFLLSEFDPLREVLGDAERLAAELGDQGRLGRACAYRTPYLRATSEHDSWGHTTAARRPTATLGSQGDAPRSPGTCR